MWKKLSDTDISKTLEKIRSKYSELIDTYYKPKTLLTSFEDRYLNALKIRQDISVFLLAEIEAVTELFDRETQKKADDEKKMAEANSETFADKVFNENRKKILKYPRLKLHEDADEEVERLIGAVRDFFINYWPAVMNIFRSDSRTKAASMINDFDHDLLTKYDSKDEVPAAELYVDSLRQIPKDPARIDNKHRTLLKETAFLLNELYFYCNTSLSNNLPMAESKMVVDNIGDNTWHKKYFLNLNNRESLDKVINHLEDIIFDFRIKDIRKNPGY